MLIKKTGNATLICCLKPALVGEMDGDPFPALSVPEVASPAGVSFVPNCNLFPPSSLPPAVSHPGDSRDVPWGAGPLSRGERQTWSRCQHFGNSPAPERDPPARGGGTPGCGGEERGEG